MRAGKIARQRQAEPSAGDILGAAIIKTMEWTERIFALVFGDAGSIIIKQDFRHAWALDEADFTPTAITHTV